MGKKILYILGFVFLLGGILGYNYYQKIFGEAITEDYVLFVQATDSMVDVKEKIAEHSKNPNTFLWVAAKKKLFKTKNWSIFIKTRNV